MITSSMRHHPLMADASFAPLMSHVIAATGLVYYANRPAELASHFARRLQETHVADCRSYLRLLHTAPAGQRELDQLITLLTIGETHFFRHRELFDAMERTVLPELIARNRGRRRLRIWSAGCSTGAEAYSVSLLMQRCFAFQLRDWDVQILGTDINRDFLARAAAATYEDWALRTIPPEDRGSYFTRCGTRWLLNPEAQRGVTFQYHNLATDPFPLPQGGQHGFDLILCRNVLIYFALDAVQRSIDQFHTALAPGGWLLVGHAEHNVDWFRRFQTVLSHGAILYHKQGADAGASPVFTEAEAKRQAPVSALDPDVAMASASWASVVPTPLVTVHPVDLGTPIAGEGEASLEEIRSLADQGDLQTALRCCQASLAARGQEPLLHFYHGLLLHQLGQQQAAELSLKRATHLDRNCLLAHYYLGLLWQQQGRVQRAIGSFRNVSRLLLGQPPHIPVPNADELTVGDLAQLTAAHLAALEAL